MLTASELNGDENKIQKRLQIIIRAHKQKQHFQRLKSVLKPQAATGGLSYILVPKNFKAEQYPYDASTIKEWETTHDQDEMQEFIQQRNIQHYHLKTKHGTTTTYYSHSTNTPIYGNGQGAGDSPSQWCQQSTMLFDLYSGLNDGATMTTSTGDASITKPLAAFADDTNLLGNDNTRTKTIDQRILQAQEGFTSWNELLHATAHFTELEKCACYLSIWKFQDDGYAYTVTPDDLEKQIEVNDLNGNKLTIRQLSATDSQKLLGVMKNPIGNQQDEIHRLKEKSNKLALQINSHALSRFEAKMAYDSFYIPAMRYSLSTTSINQMDFETIQKNATNSLMSALGYNRHMPREVVFCTQKYQGLGFKHMYDIQGTDSVRLLLQELNFNEGTTTTMIRILLEVIQQEAGMIQAPILEDNRPLQYIEWGWIPSIRDFLHHIDAKITNATTGLTIYRTNDSLIMDAPALKKVTRKEQILINRCRLCLQVECISDIASADGRFILETWFDNKTTKPSMSTKRWPIQGDTGSEAWAIWKSFLISAFVKEDGTLNVKLGEWIRRNNFRTHDAYWSRSHNVLLTRDQNDLWRHHPLLQVGRRQYVFSQEYRVTSDLPSTATPIDIQKTSTTTYTTSKPTSSWKQIEPRVLQSFSEMLLRRQSTTFFHNVKLTTDKEHMR
jgi:hypothetical protein